MKKFTKIMLILAGALATIGLVCVIAAFGMGLTKNTLIHMVKNGHLSFDEEDFRTSLDNFVSSLKEEGANTEGDSDATSNYEVNETFQDLDIEFGAGVLEVRYADVANVQVEENGISDLKVNVKENTLVIRDSTNIHINVDDINDRSLVILIPNGMQFREVDIEIGASTAEIADILADEISITVGAGEADISNLTAKQFDLEVGAGEATVVQLTVDQLDVEAGLGKVNIALNGVLEEYNYRVECGIGTVVVGTNSYSGLGAEQSVKHEGATKSIDVECGIGEVNVKFQK